MPRNRPRSNKKGSTRGYSAPALEKGMEIVQCLADAESGLTISEIAKALKRRMSELFRIIVVMESGGWLQKDPETDRYQVTYHVLRLAHRSTPAQSLTSAAGPAMHELSIRINQSCHLVVRSGTQGLVILRQENQRRHANLSVRVGAVIELVSSCSGQVLLANLESSERERLLDSISLPRGMSRSNLDDRLERVRIRGYEIRQSPLTAGVTDLCYPIRGFDNKVLAALTVPYLHALDKSLPTSIQQTRRLLEGAARRISTALGATR